MLKDFTFKDTIFQGQTIIEKGDWVKTSFTEIWI